MVTDEMVEKASEIYALRTGAADKPALRAALEAALSTDAEPVSMHDEDRTPMPAGFDEALWRKADEVHHAMALVARDQECVRIIYAALSTRDAEPFAWIDPQSLLATPHNLDAGTKTDQRTKPLYAEPVKTAPSVAVKALEPEDPAVYRHWEKDELIAALIAERTLSAQVQDVAEKPLSLGALRNYFMALREADLSWSEMPTALYTYLLMDGYVSVKAAKEQIRSELSASPASKHGEAE